MGDCGECGESLKRKLVRDHERYQCPEKEVPCLLEEFGCEEEVKRKHQMKHIEERVVDHLGIIVSVLKEQKERITRQEDEIRHLRSEVGRLSDIPMLQQAMRARPYSNS